MQDEFKVMFYHRRLLRLLKQSGMYKDIIRDKGRLAMPSGKRISKYGNIYWETRKNRSDIIGKRI